MDLNAPLGCNFFDLYFAFVDLTILHPLALPKEFTYITFKVPLGHGSEQLSLLTYQIVVRESRSGEGWWRPFPCITLDHIPWNPRSGLNSIYV